MNDNKANKSNINTIIGLIIIIFFVYILFKTGGFLIDSIKSLLATPSGATIFIGLISAIVALFTLIFNKRKELQLKREEYLYNKRIKAYEKFYDILLDSIDSGNSGSYKIKINDIKIFRKQLLLWGSGDTIRLFYEATNNKKSDGNVSEMKENVTIAYKTEELLLSMRKDLGNKTAKKGDLLSVITNTSKEEIEKIVSSQN